MNDIKTQKILLNHLEQKKAAEAFKQRRIPQWDENYALFRDRPSVNRLTGRAPANIPIAKETLKSWLANIDEPPEMAFKNKERGAEARDKEIKAQELWNKFSQDNALDILDQMDKKNVALQGRSFKMLGWDSHKKFPFITLVDGYDVLLPSDGSSVDLNKNSFVKIINIKEDLDELINNNQYDKAAREYLKIHFAQSEGFVDNATKEALSKSETRLVAMGAILKKNYSFEKKISLNLSFEKVWSKDDKQMVWYMRLYAADLVLLVNKPLKDALGIDELPIVTWSSDPDMIDVWNDGIIDAIRPVNKIVNVYFSQDIENRGYRNFGMFFYNTLEGKFKPVGFHPRKFGMFGVPGDPGKMVKQVDIPALPDTQYQIEWLKNLVQSAVAQTPTQRGQESPKATLGEIQLNLQQSNQMNSVDMKHYRGAWVQVANLFLKILEANQIQSIELWREGADGQSKAKDIGLSDWKSKGGYTCVPKFKKEQESEDNFEIQKIQYVTNNFAQNPEALKIAKRKQLELLGWRTDEVEKIMQYEESLTGAQANKPLQDLSVDQQAISMDARAGKEGLAHQQQKTV